MPRLIISPAARLDLLEIGDFIALDNLKRAATFIAEVEAKIKSIAQHPSSFPARDDIFAGLRAARHGRYLIFFLAMADEVQIVRVLHSARDLPQVFGA
jgi:toxin ParE1/3/4